MIKIDDLLGVKFTNRGRNTSEGFDCYGLAIEVSKRLGHELIDLYYDKSETMPLTEDLQKKLCFYLAETTEQQPGNLIIFSNTQGLLTHIGVILDENTFIHCDCKGVRISQIDTFYRKIWRVYKWQR